MATLATLALVRSEGNLPSSDIIPDAKLQPSLDFAVIEMARTLTADIYASAVAASVTAQIRIDCTKAEALLAVSYARPVMNIQTSGTGIVQSLGWDQSRSELMSRRDVEGLSEYFRGLALKLIAPYVPAPDDPDVGDGQTITAGSFLFASV